MLARKGSREKHHSRLRHNNKLMNPWNYFTWTCVVQLTLCQLARKSNALSLLMTLQDSPRLSSFIQRMKQVRSSSITSKLFIMDQSGMSRKLGVIMVLSSKVPQ